MELFSTKHILVDLQCTFYWHSTQCHQALGRIVFAATLNVDTKKAILLSLDAACLQRIRETTRFTAFALYPILNYEAERYFVWRGFEGAKLHLSTLSESDLRNQLDMIECRGFQDSLRVEMGIEIDALDNVVSGNK